MLALLAAPPLSIARQSMVNTGLGVEARDEPTANVDYQRNLRVCGRCL